MAKHGKYLLVHESRHRKSPRGTDLYKEYSPDEYPTYANHDAIEVGNASNIPRDFNGGMGVSVTFLSKFNPDQFEIVGSSMTLGRPMAAIG